MSPELAPQRFALRGRPYWLLAGAVMLLAVCGMLAITPLLASAGWWWASLATIGIVGAGSALLRQWGVPPVLVPVLALAGMLAFLTLTFGAGTGLLFLLPTPDTLGVFGSLVAEGQSSIQTQAVPADATAGISFLLAIGAGLLVLLMDTLAVAVRLPALAGIPVALLLILPTVVLRQDEQLWVLVLAAASFLLLMRVDVRTRRSEEAASTALTADGRRGGPRVVTATKQPGLGPLGGALGVGALGIVAALVLTAAMPLVSLGAQLGVGPPSSSLFGGAVNPLIDLGQDLRRPASVPALSYSSTGNRPVYLKMLTLDSFAGDSWVAGHSTFNRSNTVDAFPAPPGLSDNVATQDVRISVDIANVRSEWLPVPYPAKSIEGLKGQWYWDSSALTVATTHSSIAGQAYVVNGLELAPTQEDLAAAGGSYPADIARYVELPADTPTLIADTAREATAGADTPYLKAAALQKFLRGRDFSYSENTPVEDGFDGGGLRALERFLTKRSGYCIHFASAMAVMARTLDIPSRVSLGYAPGERTREKQDGQVRYNVQSSDLHAWPELYFENVGWVAFEPTPGRGAVPSYSLPSAAVAAPSVPTPGASGAPAPVRDPGALGQQGQGSAQAQAADARQTLNRTLLFAAGLLLVLSLPLLARTALHMRRRRRVRSGVGVQPLWEELTDTLQDCGHPVHDTETPRARAAQLGRVLSEAEQVPPTSGRPPSRDSSPPSSGSATPAPSTACQVVQCQVVQRRAVRAWLPPVPRRRRPNCCETAPCSTPPSGRPPRLAAG
ncbi:transglutaminaseTgpA domain-containing protein [Microterricola viridarii]|uniref:Transglutaminase-like domain-containing protein n=1 Tax=Microterricola viridarii TaxID=412690 RepID=A0A0Y0NEF1_9MICO|nr:DUF3488 and transglutaminase-like domain-containing protein [Microterricola viridarii]AMB58166.1 hypothetical protein AWU67_04060 [Microterricola viridarii]